MSEIPELPPTPQIPLTSPGEPPMTESGLPPNVAAGIAEFFSLLGGLVFYFVEKKQPFIRFHALQSAYLGAFGVLVSFALSTLGPVLAFIPVIGLVIGVVLLILLPIFSIAFVVVWLIAVIQAFNGKEWEIPWLGRLARRHLAEGLFFYMKSPAA
ncbi:MAG TPA: DUF4870 domain-containing protein [Chthoniobacterales bacterium]|jgi:uncharacterized membrane protein